MTTRNSFDRSSGEDRGDAVALAIHQPFLNDAEEARRRLQACNDGAVVLTDEEELQLVLRMAAGLDSQNTLALLEDPESYERYFLHRRSA